MCHSHKSNQDTRKPPTHSQQCKAEHVVLQLNLPRASCTVSGTGLWYCLSSVVLPFLVFGPFCFVISFELGDA